MIDLLAAVDAAFATTARGLRAWDDPHGAEMPAEEEYSRCTDPAKWRILGARADAWIEALTTAGLATVEHEAEPAWPPDAPSPSRTDVLVPRVAGALRLAIGRTAIDDAPECGIVLGVASDRSVLAIVGYLPNCGCDACDSGAANELTVVDDAFTDVVSGAFRRLTRGRSVITVHGNGRSAEWPPPEGIDAVLSDPTGWDELSGAPWR